MAVRYDPLSETFRRDRGSAYRALRDEAPVYLDSDGRFAALSRFDDVRAAAADWKTFSAVTAESKILRPIINDMDPPLHDRKRANLSRAFTPKHIGTDGGSLASEHFAIDRQPEQPLQRQLSRLDLIAHTQTLQ
jgi:cytochrome P450